VTAEETALLSALVAIDSVNPSLVAGGGGEAEIARFVERWARGAGLRVLEELGRLDRARLCA
jgi:acetylornithine deacetylase/succinyl-diaminopimelate desuccinylase-like protein